jgi:hypothetical protein
VLVTAQTKRALEVLKNKLPDKYQSLVVNYWGSDQASKDDLSSSVNFYHCNRYIYLDTNQIVAHQFLVAPIHQPTYLDI